MPHQPAHQIALTAHSMTASQLLAAPRPSAGQKSSLELLSTPPTARAPQQAPRVLRHMPTPSYSAGLGPHFPSTPCQLHRSGKSSEPSACDQSQQQLPQAKADMLQLLTGSSPVRSAHELLARLSSADTAEAVSTAACMQTLVHQHRSGRQAPQTPMCGVLSHQEDEATSAPTGANQNMLSCAMNDSPTLPTRASWAAALEQNETGWKGRRSRPTLKRAAPCCSSDAHVDKKARAFAVGMFCTVAHALSQLQSLWVLVVLSHQNTMHHRLQSCTAAIYSVHHIICKLLSTCPAAVVHVICYTHATISQELAQTHLRTSSNIYSLIVYVQACTHCRS